MPKVAVGIPVYNGAERLGWLLKSISMRTPELPSGEVQIVVVDDGSPRVHETRAVCDEWRGRGLPLTLIEHGRNRGISAGWNTCSRATDAPYVVLINDDVIVSMGWLRPLIYCLEHSPGVGVVGQSMHWFIPEDVSALIASPTSDRDVIPRNHEKQHSPERRALYEDNNPGRVMCPTGQLFGFRRSEFDAIGGFEERMQAFFEESLFGSLMARDLKKIGCQLAWPHNYHMWSASFKANPELDASGRMERSRDVYRERCAVPGDVPRGREFEYTNPKFMPDCGDVEVQFIRQNGEEWIGRLRTDGAFVDGRRVG